MSATKTKLDWNEGTAADITAAGVGRWARDIADVAAEFKSAYSDEQAENCMVEVIEATAAVGA